MALTAPRVIFGVHSVTPYSRVDGTFYGILKVLGGSMISLTGELSKLRGGSNKYPWAVEDGAVSAEMSLKVKEYPDFLFELFLGVAPTAGTTEASGNVSTLTNKKGSTVMHATTGIASVIVIPSTGAANLKFGKYVVKAVSATTVDVYHSSDADISRGTDGSYTTDTLKVAAAQTITTGAATTDIAAYGLRFTGGSGTIAMTTGDTATFEVRPINDKSMSVTIGGQADEYPEFGAIVMAQKRGNGEMLEVDCFRCKGIGLPISLQESAFSEAEIKMEAFYDSTLDGVFKIRHVTPSTPA